MTVLPAFNPWLASHGDDFDAVTLDIDGVLLLGGKPVPGAQEMIALLRRRQIPFGLLTNDGDRSVPEKIALLHESGFTFKEEELTSCSDGLVEAARHYGLRNALVFIAGGIGNPSYAIKAGLRETRDLRRLPECRAAIIADGCYDWQTVCNALLNHCLRNHTFHLLVPNPDEVYPGTEGRIVIAAGAVARFMRQLLHHRGSSLEPVFLGKPYTPIFEHQHATLERRAGRRIDPARVLMVGDSPASDIRGARAFGYRSALLLTGITHAEHLPPPPDAVPDWIFERY